MNWLKEHIIQILLVCLVSALTCLGGVYVQRVQKAEARVEQIEERVGTLEVSLPKIEESLRSLRDLLEERTNNISNQIEKTREYLCERMDQQHELVKQMMELSDGSHRELRK
jgi:predicted  nucleic acid-binding Zn-ribbon protein